MWAAVAPGQPQRFTAGQLGPPGIANGPFRSHRPGTPRGTRRESTRDVRRVRFRLLSNMVLICSSCLTPVAARQGVPAGGGLVWVLVMAITFLHAADIHLDSPLRGLERYEHAPVERIRGATRRAFERMIELAVEQQVDFVLIAGDLYDGDWRDYNTGLHLVGSSAGCGTRTSRSSSSPATTTPPTR